MKLKQLKEAVTRGGPFYPDVGTPDRSEKPNPQQGLINDLLELRAKCAEQRDRAMTCGDFVREIDALIRKNYGKFTDI